MLKTLIKKQLLEVNRAIFFDVKKQKPKTKSQIVRSIIGLGVLFLIVMTSFGSIAVGLAMACQVQPEYTWFYFAFMTVITLFLGIFGSVFNTFASLYLAKDNDLLLSLPIAPKDILISRMMSVYILGAGYSALVALPTLGIFWVLCRCSFAMALSQLLWFFDITLIVMVLSCLLGYAVALISARLKNKSYISVLIAIAFFGVYYYFCFNSSEFIAQMIENPSQVANGFSKALPIYALGQMGAGNWMATLSVTAIVVGCLALTVFVMAKSFSKMITFKSGTPVKKRSDKTVKSRSLSSALLLREFQHFASSATVMLNTGFGTLFLPTITIVLLFKAKDFPNLVAGIEALDLPIDWEGFFAIAVFAVVILLVTMNNMTASSVSLEGKTFPILRSLPIPTLEIFKAKLKMQLILTLPFAVLATVVALVLAKIDFFASVLTLLGVTAFTVWFDLFCLVLGLRFVNLNWSNETVVVKQSASVAISILGTWVFSLVLDAIAGVIGVFVHPLLGLGVTDALLIGLCVLIWHGLKTKGVTAFESL